MSSSSSSRYSLRSRKQKQQTTTATNDDSSLPTHVNLEKIENFRDIGGYKTENGRRVRKNCVFRAARLERATETDTDFLRNNIQTIIDLRDEAEQRKSYKTATPSSKHMYSGFEHRTISKTGTLVPADTNRHTSSSVFVRLFCRKKRTKRDEEIHIKLDNDNDDDDDDDDDDAGSSLKSLLDSSLKQRLLIPIGPKKSIFDYMNKNMTCMQKLTFLFDLVCCCSVDRAIKGVLPVFNTLGLYGMTEMISSDRHMGIATVLKLVAQPQLYPIVFHCMHGKDRTGLIGALILHILGVPREDILYDYSVSEGNLGKESWDETMAEYLDDEWKMSPPSVMRDLLAHLESKYGSIEQYCTNIGFGPEWQAQLQNALCEE